MQLAGVSMLLTRSAIASTTSYGPRRVPGARAGIANYPPKRENTWAIGVRASGPLRFFRASAGQP